MPQVATALPGAVGFYGKIPAERDYVRVNAGAFLQAGLDRWFQEGVEHLQRERTQLSAQPARFALFPDAGASPFIGVFAPSHDAVGRVFPVVVFASLDQSSSVEIPLLPLRLASFCAASARLAMTAHALAADQVAAEIETLASDFRPAVQALDALLARANCADLCAALGGSCEAAAYALTTLGVACAQARPSPTQVLVLDCQAPTDELRAFWLELVRRRLRTQMPSFLWTRESGRLLIALGPAPSLMLTYLADPEHKSSRRWPLQTHVERGNAMEKLSRPAKQVLTSPTASLADVLQVFSLD